MVSDQTRIRDPNANTKRSDLHFTQTHEGSEPSPGENGTVSLSLSLTGNPWTDMGIVSLCQELRDGSPAFLAQSPECMEHEVMLSVYSDEESVEDMQTWLYHMMRERWNKLYWPGKPAKILRRPLIRRDGFVDSPRTLVLLPDEKKLVKETLKAQGIPTSSVKDTVPLAQPRLNYIGRISAGKKISSKQKPDADKIRQSLGITISGFVKSWMATEGAKRCNLCGRPSRKLDRATQSMNPLLNKYHNNRVRGFEKNNYYFQTCPVCYFTNLCTSLDANIPFVYDGPNKQTLLILPDIANLELLGRVREKLYRNLRDLSRMEALHTSTNLRQYWWHDLYSLALVLFHNIFYEFSVREDKGQEQWSWEPVTDREQEITLLTRWLIVPFTKPRNVQFGNIHAVQMDHRLYDFIKPIPVDNGMPLKLVPDILSRMSPRSRHPDGIAVIRRLCQAIATSNASLLNSAVFQLWKHSDAINYYAKRGSLSRFIRHFLEVNAVLNDKLREDLRAVGITIGAAFSRDVTLISKLYNVSNQSAFRGVLSQILFRLYKLSVSGKPGEHGKLRVEAQGETKEITRVSQERITRVLDQLSSENWKEMAETLSTFTSLSAFNANFTKSTNSNLRKE